MYEGRFIVHGVSLIEVEQKVGSFADIIIILLKSILRLFPTESHIYQFLY
jgi:hypothetical protein